MALNNLPYLPLYVGDWMSNLKLKMCSANAHGIMINIMCVMHKSPEYGTILLKQNLKQSDKQIKNFASTFARILPFDFAQIEEGLNELISEKVLVIEGDKLICPRMVRDAKISEIRSISGKSGGKASQFNKKFAKDFAKAKSKAKAKAKVEANTEYENEYEINNEVNVVKGGMGGNEIVQTSHWLQQKIENQFPNVLKLKKQLTYTEAQQLSETFSEALLNEKLEAMENTKELPKKYVSVYLTLNRWCKMHNGTQKISKVDQYSQVLRELQQSHERNSDSV